MENQEIKVRVFKFETPIIYNKSGKDVLIMDYFDFERINFSLINIFRKDIQERKETYKDTMSIWLDYYNPNYSNEYAIGKIHTVSHGVEAVNIDLKSLKEKARLGKDEGILGASLFLIDKRSGYIYITLDKNNICTKYNINKYFYSAKEYNVFFRDYFKKQNEFALIDGRKRFFTLSVLSPMSLIEQIRKMESIEEIDLYPVKTQTTYGKEGLLYNLKSELSDFLPGLFKTKVSITGINGELTAEKVEQLINYLSQSDKYEQYKLIGKNNDGKPRVFSEDSSTRDILVICDTTVEGWPKQEQFYPKLIEKITNDNQLNVVKALFEDVKVIKAEDVKLVNKKDEEGGEDEQTEKSS
ncbi:hypothetical protein KXP74_001818 [Staphylococcus pseudintermedius]|uniref:hypothetical protein n=1 Tax=Staphylococcus pseudintermedius TaxID=283734 RepID=UPI001A076041|nr:hypothetical protein [Staphylococcus pseudintermedius]EGQ3474875.1 hypothetical protein [Staphylococcus pseudintermedius]EGQ3745484.1 hypothetical protein [Staphylococcus pseudintermedius]EGQ4209999.1 hypothetical protein [Staphylococcus pseudintermedius]EHS7158576.1 hypothetical protein [Staphylococcus pseudintermedius]EHT3686899.1 hypothetical protein [Staphylococcus pseudintermedius]